VKGFLPLEISELSKFQLKFASDKKENGGPYAISSDHEFGTEKHNGKSQYFVVRYKKNHHAA
jgi:hypothetical protein